MILGQMDRLKTALDLPIDSPGLENMAMQNLIEKRVEVSTLRRTILDKLRKRFLGR